MRVLVAVRCWSTTRTVRCLNLAAHRPDPVPPGTARHIVPTQHPLAPPATPSRCPAGRAGVRYWAGVSFGRAGVRSACTVPQAHVGRCVLLGRCRRSQPCLRTRRVSRTRSQGSPGNIPGGGERAAGSMTDPAGVRKVEVAGPPRMRENGARASGPRPLKGAGH